MSNGHAVNRAGLQNRWPTQGSDLACKGKVTSEVPEPLGRPAAGQTRSCAANRAAGWCSPSAPSHGAERCLMPGRAAPWAG